MLNSAIILAGGHSSRMGFDKQTVKIGDKLIVDHQIDIIGDLLPDIIIVTNRPELYDSDKYTVVSDIYPNRGPLSGLHVGLKYTNSDAALLLACDMPDLSRDYIQYLKDIYDGRGITTEYQGYLEPIHSVYPKALYPRITEILQKDDNTRPMRLIKDYNFHIVKEQQLRAITDKNVFANFNTPEELDNLLYNLDC